MSCVHLSCPQHLPVVPAAVPGVLEDALARATDAGFYDVLGVAPVWGTTAILAGPGQVCQLPESSYYRLFTCHSPGDSGPAANVTAKAAATTAADKLISAPRRVIWNKQKTSEPRGHLHLSGRCTCLRRPASARVAPRPPMSCRAHMRTHGSDCFLHQVCHTALPGVGSGAGVVEGVAVITVVCRSLATFCIQ